MHKGSNDIHVVTLTYEIVCCGLDLALVLLARVAKSKNFLLTELGVVVEFHLLVQAEI